ncbi:hypothetical protein ACFQE0_23505 [Methylobacterium komagatae]|uniref:Condensation domain-containing protein n=1 Tax=Methylobacterium komagatae TaxID=374425 RepID=A0ABW2BQZ6_9HYPH
MIAMVATASNGHRACDRLETNDLCLLDTLGPLSSMHAALDAAGVGMPCGIIARFEGHGIAEVEAAIRRASLDYPLLCRHLAWRDGRVWSVGDASLSPRPACDAGFSLVFKVGPEGRPWSYALETVGEDVLFKAVFAHAIADGYSMLHFVGNLARYLKGSSHEPAQPTPRQASMPRSFHSWLPGFLALQFRGFSTSAIEAHGPGITGTTIPLPEAARLLNAARVEGGGFGSLLAAAASLAIARTSPDPFASPVLLNLQVLRSRLEALNGFGFGAGSIMMPVRVTETDDPYAMARTISARARRLADEDWDGNLNRLIGRDPRRHHAMAWLKRRETCDPALTVSWKSRPASLGGHSGVRDVACFAASRGTHVSAHLDDDGLSISLTSRLSETARANALTALLRSLHVQAEVRCLHAGEPLDDAAGMAGTPLPKARTLRPWGARQAQDAQVGAAQAGGLPLSSGSA